MNTVRIIKFAEKRNTQLVYSLVVHYFLIIRRIAFIVLLLLCFDRIHAQAPAGTILWSETWYGCSNHFYPHGEESYWGTVGEYEHGGTYTYGDVPLSYRGGVYVQTWYKPRNYNEQEYQLEIGCASGDSDSDSDLLVEGIPTGNADVLVLELSYSLNHNTQYTWLDVFTVDDGITIIEEEKRTEENNKSTLLIHNASDLEYFSLLFSGKLATLYEITLKVAESCFQPVILPNGGTYTEGQVVTISCTDHDADIYYNTQYSITNLYEHPIEINASDRIFAWTKKGSMRNYSSQYYNIINPSFEKDGVYYNVLSIDDLTVSAIGVVDNEAVSVDIPATVVFGNRTFSVKKLDFAYPAGKNIKKISLPVLDHLYFPACNVDSLIIHCNDNAGVNLAGETLNFNFNRTVSNCIYIKIIGNNVSVVGANSYPKLKKLVAEGTLRCLAGFTICPKLEYLDLGSSTYLGDAHRHTRSFCDEYSGSSLIRSVPCPIEQKEFKFAPLDTLILNNVTCYVTYHYIQDNTVVLEALPLLTNENYNRRYVYRGSQAVQRCTMGYYLPYQISDSLMCLTIPANVTGLYSRCAKRINELVIESGEPLACCNILSSSSFLFLGNTAAKKVTFDRNASVELLNQLTCEQLTIGPHVYYSGANEVKVNVNGFDPFVKVYQVNPLTGITFENNTYLYVPLYVPRGTKEIYETADNWKNFFNIIEFDWEGPDCNISATSNNTNYGIVEGAGTYHYGDLVTLTAISNNGCTFLKWTENGTVVCTDSVYSFAADRDRIIVGEFEEDYSVCSVIVTCNNAEYGSVEGGGVYRYGERVTLHAYPNNECSFWYWTKNGSVVSNHPDYSFYVYQNCEFVANFRYGTGVEEDLTSEISVFAKDRVLSIIGTEEVAEIKVYNGLGQLVYQGFSQNIRVYNAGVYIVAVENKRIKVIVE